MIRPGPAPAEEKVPHATSPTALSRPAARHTLLLTGGGCGMSRLRQGRGREEKDAPPHERYRRHLPGGHRRSLYLLWAIGSALPGMSSTRATGVAVLALGFAASASAVVPTFGQLIHGSKTYLAITSLIGLAATAAGVQMLITANGAGLTVVMAAMAVLWLIATIHHSLLAKTRQLQQPARHGPRPAGAH